MLCLKGGVGGGGGGLVIFSLHLGVGPSVLLQLEGMGHVFSNHYISIQSAFVDLRALRFHDELSYSFPC